MYMYIAFMYVGVMTALCMQGTVYQLFTPLSASNIEKLGMDLG